nr:UbiA family prenyltransferase [Roseobacter sp.]
HQDTEDDALIGIKSTARLFGAQSPLWLSRFLAGTVTLMGVAILAAMLSSASGPIALVMALVGACVMGWHLLWQLNHFDPDDGAKLVKLFRSNRDAGLIPLLFFAVALLV